MIEHGHSQDAILGYTLGQFNAYLERSFRRERRAQRAAALAMYAAFAGGEALTKYLQDLED